MSVFPLNIGNKEDHIDKIAKLAGVDPKYFETAEEINKKRQALEELKNLIDAYDAGEGKTYTTIASAMAVVPLPVNNVPFRVENLIPTVDDGKYIYLSTETNGYKKVGEILKKASLIADGNLDVATSDKVFDYVALERTARSNADDLLQGQINDRAFKSYVDDIDAFLQGQIDTKAPINNPTFTGTVGGINKNMIGLSNVDDTSDLNKPISTATQNALNTKQDIITISPIVTGNTGLAVSGEVADAIAVETNERNLALQYKLDKTDSITKETEEEGASLANELGEVFGKFDINGIDFSKVSDSLKSKIFTIVQELGNSNTSLMSQNAITEVIESIESLKETEEEGAYLANELGEVFYKFNNGITEFSGFTNTPQSTIINNLEDIQNVSGATTGQFLTKISDGTWAGTAPIVPELSVQQIENKAIELVQQGIVQIDKRASHPMYGKNYFVFGDSHTASAFKFYSRIAEMTGAFYYESYTKVVSVLGVNETHIFIRKLSNDYINYENEFDTGVIPNCDGFNTSQTSHVIYTYCQNNNITLDYIIVANVHFAEWKFYDDNNVMIEYPPKIFINPTPTFSRLFSTAQDASIFFNTNAGIQEVVSELNFTTTDSTVYIRYGTAGQTLTFSFSSGTTLNTDTIATINFGTNTVSTNLTTGMTIEECVNAINQWAFQEFTTWINSNKGVFGGVDIPLTYSSVVGGNSTEIGILTTSTVCNLQMNTPTISVVSSAFTLQYSSNDVSGLNIASNWLTSGGNVNWVRPHTMLGALAYIGKYSPFTKWVFLGLSNNNFLNSYVYPDGTINPYSLFKNNSYIYGQYSKKGLKNIAELFGGQYIDVDKLSGINPFNIVPTFNNYNDVHMKQEGYLRSLEVIVNNIK